MLSGRDSQLMAHGSRDRESWLTARALPIAALVVWIAVLLRAFVAFGPDRRANDVDFNSDSAIPVLMSNDERPLTIFNFYYFGADRWGAWPQLVTRLIGSVTGMRWTPDGLFRAQTTWLFAGAFVVAALSSRRTALLAGAAYLIALCLHRDSRLLVYELSQLYAWQATAVLLAWYCLRRLFDDPKVRAEGSSRAAAAIRGAAVLVCSFLAIWISIASALFIAFLLHLELMRAWVRWDGRRRPAAPYALGLLAVAAATAIEQIQKWMYRSRALERYGESFGTDFGRDSGYLAANLAEQVQHIAKLSWWPLYVLPAAALLALAGVALHGALQSGFHAARRLGPIFANDTAVLAWGTYGLAASNFALAVVVDHVRLHGYDDRYLTLTNLFGPVSGMLTAAAVVTLALRSSWLRALVQPALLVAAVALLTTAFPVPPLSPEYELLSRTARDLARKAPGAVLMGSYWDTYVFAGLQTTGTMTPMPLEGEVVRMPWTRRQMRRARRVIVAFRRSSPAVPVSAPYRMRQYGVTLRLVDSNWYDNERFGFALYANDGR